jgi:hypothetical protein
MLQLPVVLVVALLTLSVPAIVCPDERAAKAITIRDMQMYLPVSVETENKSFLRFIGDFSLQHELACLATISP